MKRRNFVKNAAAATVVGLSAASLTASPQKKKKESVFHELRVYHVNFGRSQKTLTDYLKDGLIPALNRLGMKNVGVFTELHAPQPTKIYVLITYPAFKDFAGLSESLAADSTYQSACAPYLQVGSDKAIFSHYESSLMSAFESVPNIEVPAAAQTNGPRIFELRLYQSHNEDANRRKVLMFDKEETALFRKVKMMPVFFGKTLIGDNMPNLTYMLTFKDMAERDANWNDFISSDEWNKMRNLPEYADTVSNIIRTFLIPMDFSQV
ncbi:MAG: NIPSNAP family protein [Bacteroidia bacterium]|nr:NIPSNAP family protein [Bacteroidia bacterium]